MGTKGKTKTYDVHVDICGTRYFKNRKYGNADFTTRLVSKGGVYSWYEGSTEDNAFLLEEIREPKRNCLTLYEKPLASLYITGWGRTAQRNVIVYCNMTFAKDMEKYSIKHLREKVAKEMQEEREKFKQANSNSIASCQDINDGRNDSLQAHAKFGRVASCFDQHTCGDQLHRPLRGRESCDQTGRRHTLPGCG